MPIQAQCQKNSRILISLFKTKRQRNTNCILHLSDRVFGYNSLRQRKLGFRTAPTSSKRVTNVV